MAAAAAAAAGSHDPSNTEQQIAALESIEELKGLAHDELRWIAESSVERFVNDGELLFSLSSPPHHLIFVLSGAVVIKRHTSSPVSVFTGRTGRITGKTPFSRIQSWNADGRAAGNVWLLELHEKQFPALLSAVPSMTERIVWVLIERNRDYTRAEEQIGKLSALSNLAGNLAHELNNPASAARSAALALSQRSGSAKSDVRYELGLGLKNQEALDLYLGKLEAIRSNIVAKSRANISTFTATTEEALENWLREKGFEEAWKLAPILAESEVTIPCLGDLVETIPRELQAIALRDLLETVNCDKSIESVIEASERIFRIVSAVKDYSYMDRQPLQDIDLSHALDSVIAMFQPRLKGVLVEKHVTPNLPLFQGFGSELNQALSALIENALDALSGKGILTLAVSLQEKSFLVEIADNGHGIPEEYQSRVFEPFFTTKPFGGGLGLGLDTVQRVAAKHFGAVAFKTSPQGTHFYLRLPTDRLEVL